MNDAPLAPFAESLALRIAIGDDRNSTHDAFQCSVVPGDLDAPTPRLETNVYGTVQLPIVCHPLLATDPPAYM
jgi:hypothetical protein